MGCAAQLITTGGSGELVDSALAQLRQLEQRWSRFLPDSEVSALNRSAGHPVVVSECTFDLVARAKRASSCTGGRFDATILPALVSAGYEQTFASIASTVHPAGPPVPAMGSEGIAIDRAGLTVTLPPGAGFDPGGIGKGRASDLICAWALRAGAPGICVNLGGDVRVGGAAPDAAGWRVGVEDPFDPDRLLATVVIDDGAVATSSRVYRSWERAGATHHHLIDPATGEPAWTGLAAVTVFAATAEWAEVAAKALFLEGAQGASRLAEEWGVPGFAVDDGGDVHPFAGLERYLEWACWH